MSHRPLYALLLSALLVLLFAAPAAAQGTPFDQVLQAMDTVPTRAQLDAAFPDAYERLLAASADASRDPYARERALSLLSAYPSPQTRKHLMGLAADADPGVRKLAVYTVGRTFGSPGDAGLVGWLLTFLQDADPRVRDHAVRALRWVDDPSADEALLVITQQGDADLASLARITRERRKRRLGGR